MSARRAAQPSAQARRISNPRAAGIDMDSEFNRVDVAYARIKELVTHYELTSESKIILPGEHLRIEQLADYVRASATPVRQALERLHGEGLIDIVPKRGFFSRVPDAAELQDLYEFARLVLAHNLRKALEPSSAVRFGRSAMRMAALPPANSARNRAKHYAAAIEGVFEQIAQISRNEEMLRMIKNFNDRSRYIRCLVISRDADPDSELRDCLDIADGVRSQNAARACARLEAHMHRTTANLPELIREARSRWAIAAAAG
ncbi:MULTISPECIES: GntR family transcriptional regulator [unclassified Bradyrhizobium]|uniref:GntR family transcriptional regulator n=1 Tax=unclassified Bradyrhizobium TaxID=2631580 RepID=UPI0028EC6E7A|nr:MULTISPECIES: GntR family transcriptional regulator [unclassified Bradyrhizobium]